MVGDFQFKLWLEKWPVEASRPAGFVVECIVVIQFKVIQTNGIVDVTQPPANLETRPESILNPNLQKLNYLYIITAQMYDLFPLIALIKY